MSVMLIAITRPVSESIVRCELTHVQRAPIDLSIARRQHEAYQRLLQSLGVTIVSLPAEPELPDAVFVEDAAIVLDEVAVITRPGAVSRRPETASVAAALARYRPLLHLDPPATLDGGDVLRVGRRIFVGRSSRTNESAVARLRTLLQPFGYQVDSVELTGCLHLKSAATHVGDGLLLVNPDWLSGRELSHFDQIAVDPGEPMAANALLVGSTVVHGSQFPRTRGRLEKRGLIVAPVDCTELAKAEGAVTCCSILVDVADDSPRV
jgi:dimethylargininase